MVEGKVRVGCEWAQCPRGMLEAEGGADGIWGWGSTDKFTLGINLGEVQEACCFGSLDHVDAFKFFNVQV